MSREDEMNREERSRKNENMNQTDEDKRNSDKRNSKRNAGSGNPAEKHGRSRTEGRMTLLERYLVVEIGIEFKACLYFFCILFFYSVYRMIGGRMEAGILHMGEMILLTYGMGYVQFYLLSGFDEGDRLGAREIGDLLLCVGVYTAVSYLGRWFDRSIPVTVLFALYMTLAYLCGFLVYKIKRILDAKQLNEELRAFQERSRDETGY